MLDGEEKSKPKDELELNDEELAVLLDKLNRNAVGYLSDEVSADSDNALDRYLGKPYGDEEEGMSQAMSMDVAEVVDWALPDLLEPFIAGDRVVEYEASKEADEAWVENAADLANHVFHVENRGVIFLYDTIKTALIQKIGYSKTYWKDEKKDEEQKLSGLSIMNVMEMQQDKTIEIVSIEAEPVNVAELPEEVQAAFEDGNVYTIAIEREVKCGKVVIESVPPEEIKVASRSSDIEDIEYIAHEVEVPRWKLIAMGFDRDKVESLASEKKAEESRADHRFFDETRRNYENHLKTQEVVTLIEEYPMLDLDGDGDAERWQIFRVGKTILDKQEVTSHPFDCWTADRIPHRLIGLALADKVKQTQKIKTHLTRDLLNNIYMANRPRIEVPDGATNKNTINDLLNIRIGGLIRTTGKAELKPILTPDRTGTALTAITYMDGVREQQSGITRNGLAVSSEVVDPKSATESNRQSRNEQVRKRLMCRMIAETFLVPVFRKILTLMVSYQEAEKTIKVAGKWVPMNPRAWDANALARTSVGLGHANRDEEMAAAQIIIGAQAQAYQIGLADKKRLYNAGAKLVKAVGWRNPEDYFLNPDSDEGKQAAQMEQQSQGQDPKMLEVQGKLQLQGEKAQTQTALEQAKLQLKKQEQETKAQIAAMTAQVNANAKMQIEQMSKALEAQLAERQQDIEAALSRYEIDRSTEAKMHASSTAAKSRVENVQFGGKIG